MNVNKNFTTFVVNIYSIIKKLEQYRNISHSFRENNINI